MEDPKVEPYTIEPTKKQAPSMHSLIYLIAAILVPFIIWVGLSLAPDSTAIEIARMATSIVVGAALVVFGINLLRISKSRNESQIFVIAGIVISSLFTLAAIFLALVVMFALIAVSLQ